MLAGHRGLEVAPAQPIPRDGEGPIGEHQTDRHLVETDPDGGVGSDAPVTAEQKNISTLGEGGIVVTNDAEVFERVLVPVDLTDRNRRALEVASRMAGDPGEVTLLHVIETLDLPFDDTRRIVDYIRITREGFPAQKLDLEGITLDGEGNFYVADYGNDRIQKFDGDGTFLLAFVVEFIGVVAQLIAIAQIVDHPPGEAGEGRLILQHLAQILQRVEPLGGRGVLGDGRRQPRGIGVGGRGGRRARRWTSGDSRKRHQRSGGSYRCQRYPRKRSSRTFWRVMENTWVSRLARAE